MQRRCKEQSKELNAKTQGCKGECKDAEQKELNAKTQGCKGAKQKNRMQRRRAEKMERKGAMSVEFSQVVHYAMYAIFYHLFTEIDYHAQFEVGESKIGECLGLK